MGGLDAVVLNLAVGPTRVLESFRVDADVVNTDGQPSKSILARRTSRPAGSLTGGLIGGGDGRSGDSGAFGVGDFSLDPSAGSVNHEQGDGDQGGQQDEGKSFGQFHLKPRKLN